jgi:hypothetical protein
LPLAAIALFTDHGKVKVSGRKKNKKYTPWAQRIIIATIVAADATSMIIGTSLMLLLFRVVPWCLYR